MTILCQNEAFCFAQKQSENLIIDNNNVVIRGGRCGGEKLELRLAHLKCEDRLSQRHMRIALFVIALVQHNTICRKHVMVATNIWSGVFLPATFALIEMNPFPGWKEFTVLCGLCFIRVVVNNSWKPCHSIKRTFCRLFRSRRQFTWSNVRRRSDTDWMFFLLHFQIVQLCIHTHNVRVLFESIRGEIRPVRKTKVSHLLSLYYSLDSPVAIANTIDTIVCVLFLFVFNIWLHNARRRTPHLSHIHCNETIWDQECLKR